MSGERSAFEKLFGMTEEQMHEEIFAKVQEQSSIVEGSAVTSECPTCGLVDERTAYDIGSGPELSCANCEWCWGARGQDLKQMDVAEVRRWAQEQGR